jgi:non-ribosomal peptide synthetase component F
MASDAGAAQLRFWQRQLDGPELRLPGDRPRDGSGAWAPGGRTLFSVPASLRDSLRALGRRERSTLSMVLFTGFALLMRAASHQDDFTISTSNANRNRRGTEDLIGYFAQNWTLRMNLSDNQTVGELLARVRSQMLDAYANSDVELPPPEVAVRFTFQYSHPMTLPGLTPVPWPGVRPQPPTPPKRERFDLFFTVADAPEGIRGQLRFNASLFTERTVSSLVTRYLAILSAMNAQPEARIDELLRRV